MDDLTLAVKLAMDNSSFQQGIQNLKREMEVVQSQFRESTAGIKDWGKNLDSMKSYADALTQKIDIQKKVVQAYQEQLEKAKQGLEENAKKMLDLKSKVEQAEQAWKNSKKTLGENAEETQKLKAEYEKLKKEYDQQEQKVRNNQKTVEGYTIQLNNAKSKLNEMESELRQATSEIDKQSNAWIKLSEKAKEVGEKLKSVGDKMSSVGKDLSMKLTAPIVGAGAAAVKFASDLNESINKVDVAFKNNANEVKNWSDTTLTKFGIAKGTALDMAAGFGDMATSMGLNTKQAAEMSTKLVGLAGDLASFKNISIDVANTALTSVFTGETESLKKLGIVMTEANLQEFALSKGIKTRVKDMSEAEKVQLRYNFVMEKTINAHGDFERTGVGTANQMRIFKESLKQLAETFGQQLLPIITPMIQKLNEMIQKFAGLDDRTKKIITIFAGVVAAMGPLVMIIGKVISIAGTLSTVIGTVSGAMAAATTATAAAGTAVATTGGAFAALAGPIGIAIAAIAGIGLAGYGLYKHFSQSAIPAVKLFGDETSESTKKAIGAYMDMDQKAGQSLMHLKLTGQIVSKETADNLIQIFNDMGSQIKQGLDKHFNESYNSLQNFFKNSTVLSSGEEAKILADMKSKNDAKKKETDNYTKQIKEILTKASNEKRDLTADEQQKINEIQAKMKVNAVKSLSDTELESKAILERMKQQAGNLTAQQAVEVVKNSLDQKNKAIENANKQYNETVKAIIKQRDETGTITKEQADKLIKETTRQKDETIKKAEEMHNKVVGEAKKQAGEHVNQVDWEKGQVKTKWQEMKDNISQKINDIASNTKKGWNNIKTDAANKVQEMKNSIINKYNEIKISVSNKIQEIKNTASVKWNELLSKPREVINNIKGYFTNLKLSIPSIGTSTLSLLKSSVSDTISRIKSHFGGLRLSLPSISIPHIKLPHFSIRGSFSIVPPRVPTLDVNWYATGGIFNRPSIIGVGEAGTEAVLPIDRLDELMARAIEKVGNKGTQIIFQGNYSFAEKKDIDYFMSKAAQLVQRRKG
ncbi:hypothetical protein SAMN05428976_11350 [Clostridium sp. USBA 49]|uniref:phage tail tape measure protein n=1 Tax=Clostridium sp. USBA 49 TaxID=1881060 RepID=UPI00099A9B20|nr:phage tail tape measure protein [Clostridium sp. USBA 49]SKA89721.1 hypothetical protein SAMN05428976_11350 [Clostridium sp. USBA 49]